MAIITLLTDFGTKDEYVGVLKGVILGTAPDATIVDISHWIEPQDIEGAAHTLRSAYTFFPEKTIHVVVVDPGVGTQRTIIAAKTDGHLFLAPNNGVLSPILSGGRSVKIHTVENRNLFRHPVSRTFHGRDVFAPVAAHLSRGLPLASLGPAIDLDRIQPLGVRGPDILSPRQIEGRIVAVDRFGNLITNIHAKDLSRLEGDRLTFTVATYTIDGMVESYANSGTEGPLAIIGSRDCVEIAIHSQNASRILNLGKGATIRVATHPKPGR